MFKVNNRNTKTRCEICFKVTIKTPERRHFIPCSSVSIVNFERVNADWLYCFAKKLHYRYLTGFWIHLWGSWVTLNGNVLISSMILNPFDIARKLNVRKDVQKKPTMSSERLMYVKFTPCVQGAQSFQLWFFNILHFWYWMMAKIQTRISNLTAFLIPQEKNTVSILQKENSFTLRSFIVILHKRVSSFWFFLLSFCELLSFGKLIKQYFFL